MASASSTPASSMLKAPLAAAIDPIQKQIVDAAIQEDAGFIGMSVLSGAHSTLFAEVMDLLKARNAEDIVVFGGGTLQYSDANQFDYSGRFSTDNSQGQRAMP
mgnify:CR=1 FL=1